jgi:hypothetical protein
MENNIHKIGKELFITSDEEIKIGTWILDNILANKKPIRVTKELLEDGFLKEDKKIILTTDQDLIKDNVQAIDDEFLEWFVKNPSCEEVEVEKDKFFESVKYNFYKIIIPKEEPKQHVELINDNIEEFDKAIELFKQETTLEEAAERYVEEYKWEEERDPWFDFMEGAKWQQEQMLAFINDEDNHTEGELGNSCIDVQTLVNFIEQFKNK